MLSYFKLKNIKMLVFDMAGTTINENGIVYETLYSTMKDFGLHVPKSEQKFWHGANKKEILDNYLVDNNVMTQNIQEDLHTKFFNNLKEQYFESNNIELIHPKLPELLTTFRENDIKVTLNTGYNREIQNSIIHRLNMSDYISDYVCSEDVSRGRPYPYMIYKLMERNDIINAKQVVKIGDSNKDIFEGINAGCFSSIGVLSGIGMKGTLRSSDMILDSVMDLNREY
jgi:phosphonatase-like hydrolase